MRTSASLLVAATLVAGCDSTTKPASPQPPAANSSYLAIAAVGETHKIYFPTIGPGPNAQLAVVDAATRHGRSGVIRYIDLGTLGVAVAVGASGTDVVAVDAVSPSVYFVDAATDTLKGTVPLPAEAVQRPNSDRAAYGAGVAVDSARRRAFVAVSYGILEYDLDARTLVATHRVPASENFAYDPTARRLWAPYYPCDPGANPPGACVTSDPPGGVDLTDGLTLVDLADAGAAYSFEDPAAVDPTAPLGREVDSVSLDFGLGVAAVAVEGTSALRFLDLDAPVLDAGTSRWQAATFELAMPGPFYTVMVADAATHVLLVGQEYDTGMVAVDLVEAKAGTATAVPLTMPARPDGTPWATQGEPLGAVNGTVDGRPYAFLVSDDRGWIARVDLTGVRAILDGGAGDFAALVAYFSVPPPP